MPFRVKEFSPLNCLRRPKACQKAYYLNISASPKIGGGGDSIKLHKTPLNKPI
jgi:hypothetical protein